MPKSFRSQKTPHTNAKKHPVISDLYPNMPPEDQAEAEYNLKLYVALVWRIYQRTKRENPKI